MNNNTNILNVSEFLEHVINLLIRYLLCFFTFLTFAYLTAYIQLDKESFVFVCLLSFVKSIGLSLRLVLCLFFTNSKKQKLLISLVIDSSLSLEYRIRRACPMSLKQLQLKYNLPWIELSHNVCLSSCFFLHKLPSNFQYELSLQLCRKALISYCNDTINIF